MVRFWKQALVSAGLLAIGVGIGSFGRATLEDSAEAQVRRVGSGGAGDSASGATGTADFPMTVYKGPNRTVKFYTAGKECQALNVAEILVYPDLMVFKDNRDVIGGTGLMPLGEFKVIVGQ